MRNCLRFKTRGLKQLYLQAPMTIPAHRIERARAGVLLLAKDQSTAHPYADALRRAGIPVELVTTMSELQSRLTRTDLPPPGLFILLPTEMATLLPGDLVSVALQMTAGDDAGPPAQPSTQSLDDSLNAYCAARSLSRRQRQVLELYLRGKNDKEIACSFECSATTVYEYWRRMAKKANGMHKSDVVNDFHGFLAARSAAIRPRLLAAAPRPSTRPVAPSP